MSEAELLSVLKSIDSRLGGVESRLGNVETRLGNVETRLGDVETRLGDVETRLGDVETRLGDVETRLGKVETRLDVLEKRFDEMEAYVARQPDLRLIGHQMAALIERVNELHATSTRAIAALNDVARESVTPGEVEALHSELKEIRSTEFNLDVRVRRIEAELHL